MSIAHTLMAFFAIFSTVFKTYETRYIRFAQNKLELREMFNSDSHLRKEALL